MIDLTCLTCKFFIGEALLSTLLQFFYVFAKHGQWPNHLIVISRQPLSTSYGTLATDTSTTCLVPPHCPFSAMPSSWQSLPRRSSRLVSSNTVTVFHLDLVIVILVVLSRRFGDTSGNTDHWCASTLATRQGLSSQLQRWKSLIRPFQPIFTSRPLRRCSQAMFTLQRALTIALSCLGLAQVSSPALGLSGTQGGDDGDEEG